MRPLLQFRILVALATLIALASALSGCGKGEVGFDSEAMINSRCMVATDQRQSFMARVPGFPVRILVDADFTFVQRAGVERAASVWNGLGRELTGSDFFQVTSHRFGDDLRSLNPAECENAFGSKDSLAVMRERSSTRWSALGFTDHVPGATLRCFSGRTVNRQTILVFTQIIDDAQFTSVVLHELGHSLGLDHSCAPGGGRSKHRACAGLDEDHPYHVAVMYPSIRAPSAGSRLPEIKENLRPNDILRTGCLYPE